MSFSLSARLLIEIPEVTRALRFLAVLSASTDPGTEICAAW